MKEQRKEYGKLLWVLIAVILPFVLLLEAVMLLPMRGRAPGGKEGPAYEASAVAGDVPGKSRGERQRELNSVVEEGILAIPINATPSGKGTGKDRSTN